MNQPDLSDADIDALLVRHGKGDDGFHAFARAILAADPERRGEVTGWVLVPREPTQKMLEIVAGLAFICEDHTFATAWRAAIAAATEKPHE